MASRSQGSDNLSLNDLVRLTPDESEIEAVWEEIERQNHRAAGVLAGAMVEEVLQFALMCHMVFQSKTDLEKLFEYPEPLSSFDAKIRMGYALGLYGRIIRNDLDVIRRVRNAFAHAKKPITFTTPKIAKEVAKLRYTKEMPNQLVSLTEHWSRRYDSEQRTSYAVTARIISHKLFVICLPLGKRAERLTDLP